MGFPSVCFVQKKKKKKKKKKKSHGIYGEKRKFRPYIETNYNFLHALYGGKRFFQDILRYTNKNQWSFYLR